MKLDSSELIVKPDQDLADLIPNFITTRHNDLKDIRAAIARNDFVFVARTAHTLKGICRPYGFMHLETLSKSIEKAAEAKSLAEVEDIANQIEFYLQNLKIVYEP
jgi:HPt (histidine-containing phosphotransfer) domain-containing protein